MIPHRPNRCQYHQPGFSHNLALQRSGWIGAFLESGNNKNVFGSINVILSSRPLNAKPLGCSCATLSWVALPIATLSYHAQSHTKAPRMCPFRPKPIASCPSCAKRPHPCPSRLSVIAPGSLACKTSSLMPTLHQPDRAMPRSCAKLLRACSPHLSGIVPCPLVCEISSHMLISHRPDRAVPTRVRNGILNDPSSPTGACC